MALDPSKRLTVLCENRTLRIGLVGNLRGWNYNVAVCDDYDGLGDEEPVISVFEGGLGPGAGISLRPETYTRIVFVRTKKELEQYRGHLNIHLYNADKEPLYNQRPYIDVSTPEARERNNSQAKVNLQFGMGEKLIPIEVSSKSLDTITSIIASHARRIA